MITYSEVAAKMEFCGSSVSIVESSPSGTGWFEAAAPLDDEEEGCRLCAGLGVEPLIFELPLVLIGGDSLEPSATDGPDR